MSRSNGRPGRYARPCEPIRSFLSVPSERSSWASPFSPSVLPQRGPVMNVQRIPTANHDRRSKSAGCYGFPRKAGINIEGRPWIRASRPFGTDDTSHDRVFAFPRESHEKRRVDIPPQGELEAQPITPETRPIVKQAHSRDPSPPFAEYSASRSGRTSKTDRYRGGQSRTKTPPTSRPHAWRTCPPRGSIPGCGIGEEGWGMRDEG